jgi:hypothetical protein
VSPQRPHPEVERVLRKWSPDPASFGKESLIALVTGLEANLEELFALQKRIDGAPHINGSWPIVAQRTGAFLYQRIRQPYYEQLESYEELWEQIQFMHVMRTAGVQQWMLDHFSITYELYSSGLNPAGGELTAPVVGEALVGLHHVGLTGGWRQSGHVLQFANSWGRNWGDRGHGWISREYSESHVQDIWLRRNSRYGSGYRKLRVWNAAETDHDRAQIWKLDNSRWARVDRLNGHAYKIVGYETLSVSGRCLAEVVEIRNGFGVRVAWAHLQHRQSTPPTSVIAEFFVWPWFRRAGLATRLEEVLLHRASVMSSTQVEVLLHGFDARPLTASTYRRIGEGMGYTWRRAPRAKYPELVPAWIGLKTL